MLRKIIRGVYAGKTELVSSWNGPPEIHLVPPETAEEKMWWATQRWRELAVTSLKFSAFFFVFFGVGGIVRNMLRDGPSSFFDHPLGSLGVMLVGATLLGSGFAAALRNGIRKNSILERRFYYELNHGDLDMLPGDAPGAGMLDARATVGEPRETPPLPPGQREPG
jgi:hypothetical protein